MFAESFITLSALLSLQGGQYQEVPPQPVPLNRLPVSRYVPAQVPLPIKAEKESVGVDVTARGAAVMDVASGELLFEKNADEAYPIASLSKLMTAMTFLDTKPNLKEEVIVTAEDDPHEGKTVFFAGERFTKQELFDALLIGSVNTAGNTLARTTGAGREEFVRRMNRKAQELGLSQASFFEPTGLDARNKASARDVAIMLRAALSYPEIRETTEKNHLSLVGRATKKPYEIDSTNLLLGSFLNKPPYQVIAAKTGSLPEAKFCLAQVTRHQDGGEVIAVVLGSDDHFSRFQDAKALTYWAFQTYKWPAKAQVSLR